MPGGGGGSEMPQEDLDPSLTRMLNSYSRQQAGEQSLSRPPEIEALYEQCREVVKRVKSRSSARGDMDTTDLLHRAWERTLLAQGSAPPADRWNSREHFFATLAKATIESIIDERRLVHARKRGDGVRPRRLGEVPEIEVDRRRGDADRRIDGEDRAALRQALDEFGAIDPRACTVVVLRAFWQFAAADIAAAIGVSERSVNRDWRAGRAWLARRVRQILGMPSSDAGEPSERGKSADGE